MGDRKLPPHLNPMTDREVREVRASLSATLRGPLPQAPVQRMLAPLARHLEERQDVCIHDREPGCCVSCSAAGRFIPKPRTDLREMPNPGEPER